jgi:hypothetical protein
VKYFVIVGGYIYNQIQGACTEDFIDSVMVDVDERENAVKFIEISEEEWDDYENWPGNLGKQQEILSRQRLQPRRITGWKLE